MELEEERTENTKLFLLEDGSKMLAEYTELYSADYDTDYTKRNYKVISIIRIR